MTCIPPWTPKSKKTQTVPQVLQRCAFVKQILTQINPGEMSKHTGYTFGYARRNVRKLPQDQDELFPTCTVVMKTNKTELGLTLLPLHHTHFTIKLTFSTQDGNVLQKGNAKG